MAESVDALDSKSGFSNEVRVQVPPRPPKNIPPQEVFYLVKVFLSLFDGDIAAAPTFSLFTLTSPLLLAIVGSIFVISSIASVQPLIRNVRRNPIQDMRED